MILPKASPHAPEPKTITLADGQTFVVLVAKPSFNQRFEDEGREILAFGGRDDAWTNYRLGRIQSAIVDWQDMTNDKLQPIPFSVQRLLGLMEAAPEIVEQIQAITNEVFRRPLPVAPKSPEPPATSGATTETAAPSPTNSDSTTATDVPSDSLANLESPPAS